MYRDGQANFQMAYQVQFWSAILTSQNWILKLYTDYCNCDSCGRRETSKCKQNNAPLYCSLASTLTPLLLHLYLLRQILCTVEQIDSVKHLGVRLTTDLSWTEHIGRICNKTWKLTRLMYSIIVILTWCSDCTKPSFVLTSSMPCMFGILTCSKIKNSLKRHKSPLRVCY